MRIVLGGPPRSGKSCLRERLKQALQARGGPYPYVISANPDGEGAWFQETWERDPELAQRLKAANKAKWSEDHARLYEEFVRNCALPLVLIDVGGIVDDRNERICRAATDAVLLAPDRDGLAGWREFCERLDLRVIAEIVSDYHAEQDSVEGVGPDGCLRGVVHYLERGELRSHRPMVDALAGHILELVEGQPSKS